MNLPVLADWLTLIFAPIVIVCAFLIWRAQRSVRGVEGAVSALGPAGSGRHGGLRRAFGDRQDRMGFLSGVPAGSQGGDPLTGRGGAAGP
ncbi:hypothetical protein GCM10027203_24930 [Nonomuraea fastidiosa]|jgi:hypothetical protein